MCTSQTFMWVTALGLTVLLVACTAPRLPIPEAPAAPVAPAAEKLYPVVNRISWGACTDTLEQFSQQGWSNALASQLHPAAQMLPVAVQKQIDAMTISSTPLPELVQRLEQQRKDADDIKVDEAKKAAQQAYQQELNRLLREASARHLLRALYSPNQVQEQMTWFWLNHFNIYHGKSNLRAMVGDYEENALRPHALGNFRDLLGAVATHPAMLRYLDNEQNAVGHLNENFSRELMELHTLGVDGGYTQQATVQIKNKTAVVAWQTCRAPAPAN